MLFDYGSEQPITLWMKDCMVPVSVAFLDATGRILNLADLRPLDETVRRRSRGAARYALATSHGWFAAHQVARGTRVELLRRVLLPGETAPRMPVVGPLAVPSGDRSRPPGTVPLGAEFSVDFEKERPGRDP
jgi:hypothetical protein